MLVDSPILKTGKVDLSQSAIDSSDDNVQLLYHSSQSQTEYFRELTDWVCDDLEQNWKVGNLKPIKDYQSTFPELFHHKPAIQSIIDFEYTLRLKSGENPSIKGYLPQWGVMPRLSQDISVDTPRPVRAVDQTVIQAVVPIQNPDEFLSENDVPTQMLSGEDSQYDEYEQISKDEFPIVGQTVEGFHLRELLGCGAFAQVYLAEQVGLSNRLVAIKLTRRLGKEAGRLARLQHANVVPIFSFHPGRDWQAICMPFFGRQTLEDIIRMVRESQRVPKSGCEVFSTIAAKGDSTVKSSAISHPSLPNGDTIRPSDAGSHGKLRNVLTNLSYSDAAVLLVAQIADGLAHAHSLGIWHLDLKPANVLISDHGQPMLLDFNLAFDTAREDRQRFGGTVAYMAPEQIDEMIESRRRHQLGLNRTGPRVSKVDHRSDLFSLGVILFELLTGRHPFPVPKTGKDPFESARIVRELPRPTARELNPSISQAIDAIIERLLSNNMEERYPSAVALRQDLIGHLEHRTLVYIKEPSLIERFVKWHHRHPKALIKMLATASLFFAVSAMVWGYRHWNQSVHMAARDQIVSFRSELNSLRLDLADFKKPDYLLRGIKRATELFDQFEIDENTDLKKVALLNRLETSEREVSLADFSEIAVLTSLAVRSDNYVVTTEVRNREIEKWQGIADICFSGQATPAILGGKDLGSRTTFITGTISLREGRYEDAIEQFDQVVKDDPQNAAAHTLFAEALIEKQLYARATERSVMAAALIPNDLRPKFSRAKIFQGEGDMKGVETCMTDILRFEKNAENLYTRANALYAQRKYTDALTDSNEVIEMSGGFYRVFLLRHLIHKCLRNEKLAQDDWKSLTECNLKTPEDFFRRGFVRLNLKNYVGAIEDYRNALALNPQMYEAMYNIAYIYGERLNDLDSALESIEEAIELNVEHGKLHVYNAVVLARLGKRGSALKALELGLKYTNGSSQMYNAACVYSLTSKTNPADADKAVGYLKQAIRDGVIKANEILSDPDIKPIIDRNDVRKLLEAAKSLN